MRSAPVPDGARVVPPAPELDPRPVGMAKLVVPEVHMCKSGEWDGATVRPQLNGKDFVFLLWEGGTH